MVVARLVRWTGSLLVGAIVARVLGPTGFGQYSVAIWVLTTAGILATYGFSSSGVRFVARALSAADGSVSAVARFMLLCTLPLSAVALVAVVGLAILSSAGISFGAPPALLLVGAIGVPLAAIVSVSGAFLLGSQHFLVLTGIQIGQIAVLVVLTVAVALFAPQPIGFVAATVGAAAAGATLSLAALRRLGLLADRRPLEPRTRADVLAYSHTLFTLVIAEIVVWQRSEILVLGVARSAAELGLYAAAFGLVAGMMDAFPRAFGVTYFPALSGEAGTPRFRETLGRALPVVGLIGAVLAASLVAGGGSALELIYGDGYAAAGTTVSILAVAGALGALGGLSASALYALGRERQVLLVTIIGAAVNIGADIVLIPSGGIVGAAIANGIGQGFVTVALMVALGRRGEITFSSLRSIGRLAVSAAAGAAIGLVVAAAIAGRISILVTPILVGLVAVGATMLVLQALGGDVRGVARAVVSRSH
jgi:O-antigen/teichoic acid export membrane protein